MDDDDVDVLGVILGALPSMCCIVFKDKKLKCLYDGMVARVGELIPISDKDVSLTFIFLLSRTNPSMKSFTTALAEISLFAQRILNFLQAHGQS